MAKKTRTEITVERRQRTVVRMRRGPRAAWCEGCAGLVPMLTPDEAAALAGTTAREIFRRVEAGELHFLETADGALLICGGRLLENEKERGR